jgi:hypothetical protein
MQYLILHGSFGSPQENWFTWLKNELESLGHSVILEQFPVDDWDTLSQVGVDHAEEYQPVQSLASWEEYFVTNIKPKVESTPTVCIAHSIAPVFMLHMMQKYDFKLAGAIWVAPFFNIPYTQENWMFYPVNKTFYHDQFDFNKIKSQLGKSYVVYGDNDPYVPATEPPRFAQALGSEIVVVKDGEHCGSKFKQFPLILQLLEDLILPIDTQKTI